VKSNALPVILSGDCSVALAVVAGARRYFRNVSMVYMDRDADLNTPATTPSGCVDGMVVSHLTGRGAAELVRFWGEPPLVREPDLALFGVARLDPPEERWLSRSTLRCYLADDVLQQGAAAAAQMAIERIHSTSHEFVLHLDVDVIAGFTATNYPGTGGLTLDDVREALRVFAKQKHLAAVEITAYNPTKDSDGKAAATILDLLQGFFAVRLDALKEAATSPQPASAVAGAAAPDPAGSANGGGGHDVPSPLAPPAGPAETPQGEASSSGSLEAPEPTSRETSSPPTEKAPERDDSAPHHEDSGGSEPSDS